MATGWHPGLGAVVKGCALNGGLDMMKWLSLCCLVALMGCGDAAETEESENENQDPTPVETWGVTQQCEFLGAMYGCDGDFAAWDVFMTSCETSIPESCSGEDQALLSGLFACLETAGAHQSCSDEDYAACESVYALSGLSATCDEVIALTAG